MVPLKGVLTWCVQPGVANVYCAVTQHSRNGATFYLESFPSMTGRPYKYVLIEITNAFMHCSIACWNVFSHVPVSYDCC